MPGKEVIFAIEAVGMLISVIASMMQKAGLSAEEAKRVLDEEYAKFIACNPANLPDIR